MPLLALIVLGGFALYVMTPAERERLFQAALRVVARARKASSQAASGPDPFMEGLIERTRWPIVTLSIVVANGIIFVGLLFGSGKLSDPQTLIEWGASFGPRTTNGEWWRLVSSLFVHTSLFHLLFNCVGLVRLGFVLERVVGHSAFAVVYLSAGAVASLVNLSTDAIAVNVGSAGAVLGVYGLIVTCLVWGRMSPSPVSIPVRTLKMLAPHAALFILYNLMTGGFNSAAVCGFVVGFVYGAVLTKDVSVFKPSARLTASAAVVTIVVGTVLAIPVRGVADVRPELDRIAVLEEHTSRLYQKAVGQFRLGAINAKALAQVIDRTIVPEVHAARERLKKIDGVPPQHEALVASAEEYLKLRNESWRMRSEALHSGNMPGLQKADRVEWASLQAFEKMRH
jgi:membrane associated rhomboid family serine protease